MSNKQNNSELSSKDSCDRHEKHQQLVHFARYATAARRCNATVRVEQYRWAAVSAACNVGNRRR